jgi:signal transduction histidine kinase
MQTNFRRDTFFPIIVGVLSIVNLVQQFSELNIISTVVSLIGIIGVILFFLKRNQYKLLIYIWIVTQLVSIIYVQSSGGYIEEAKEIWNAIQADLGFHVSLTINGLIIQFNIVAIFYLVLFRALRVSELKGIKLTFSRFKEDSVFGGKLPVNGEVVDVVKIGDEKEWMVVQLDTPIVNDDTEIKTVLVKRKDGEVFELSGKNQIVYFRLVKDFEEIYSPNRISQFPFVEWVLCK